jgi:hypothetical protein
LSFSLMPFPSILKSCFLLPVLVTLKVVGPAARVVGMSILYSLSVTSTVLSGAAKAAPPPDIAEARTSRALPMTLTICSTIRGNRGRRVIKARITSSIKTGVLISRDCSNNRLFLRMAPSFYYSLIRNCRLFKSRQTNSNISALLLLSGRPDGQRSCAPRTVTWGPLYSHFKEPGSDSEELSAFSAYGVGGACCSPSLRTVQAGLPHTALRLVVHLGKD